MISKQFRIGGMTCINCQNKIQQKLSNTAGISEVRVSYEKGTAKITYDTDLISLHEIVDIIKNLDYTVLSEGEKESDFDRVASSLIIIVSLYIVLQKFGILNLLVPSQLADTGMGYGMLFVVGLMTSVHCIAMCGGINLSQCISQKNSSQGSPQILYNLGRVVSYTVIGFILGAVGMILGGGAGVGLPFLVQGILKLIAGALMVIMGINMLGLFPWLRKFSLRIPGFLAARISQQEGKSRQPFIVGLLNGLMPCGPLQSMQIVALASGNPLAGALSMMCFSLGTVPLMLGLGSIVSALGKRFAKAVMNVGAVLVVVLGLTMISQGGSLSGILSPESLLAAIIVLSIFGLVASFPFRKPLYRMAALSAAAVVLVCTGNVWGYVFDAGASEGTLVESPAEDEDVQVINSTLSLRRYPDITVEAGTPVRWVIDAPAGSINGCNYRMVVPEYNLVYSFQEGENIIEFTPTETGTYLYYCWMGMIQGSISVTEAGEETAGAGPEEAEPTEGAPSVPAYGGSCCDPAPVYESAPSVPAYRGSCCD